MKYLITSVECACSKGQKAESFVLTGPGRISREKQRPENVFRKSPAHDYCVAASLFPCMPVRVCVSIKTPRSAVNVCFFFFITLFLVFFFSFHDNHGLLVILSVRQKLFSAKSWIDILKKDKKI